MNEQVHKSVLLDETIGFLSPADGRVFIDATLGLGGHAKAILECGPGIAVIGIDQDPDALKLAKKHLANFGKRVRFYHANFSDISRVAAEAGVSIVDGILADLGISSITKPAGVSIINEYTWYRGYGISTGYLRTALLKGLVLKSPQRTGLK